MFGSTGTKKRRNEGATLSTARVDDVVIPYSDFVRSKQTQASVPILCWVVYSDI